MLLLFALLYVLGIGLTAAGNWPTTRLPKWIVIRDALGWPILMARRQALETRLERRVLRLETAVFGPQPSKFPGIADQPPQVLQQAVPHAPQPTDLQAPPQA